MKPKATPKKSAARRSKNNNHSVNIRYVEEVAADAISTIMALSALVKQLAAQLEEARDDN